MYSYSIDSTNLAVFILPNCCNKFSQYFCFNPRDSFCAAKKNLLFTCPFCKKVYPSVNKLFVALSILNVIVGKFNSYILAKKKKGFTITLPITGSVYSYLDELISFEKLFKNIPIEDVNESEYEESVYNLISYIPDKEIINKPHGKLSSLSEVRIYCKKCETSFDLIDRIESKNNLTCEECNNHVVVPNKDLKEILSAHKRLKSVLTEQASSNITIIPFSLHGMYMTYATGDNSIYNFFNKQK